MQPTLIIGNKNYSSWSLRPWLLLKQSGIPFEEVQLTYLSASGFAGENRTKIFSHTPAGKVPVLKQGHITCWDSLAICEFIAEQHPELELWPRDTTARAMARSICNEMHSGFFEIRNLLPMNCRARTVKKDIPSRLQAEINRVCTIWANCRNRHGQAGPFLFGRFSIADAMYAPVTSRFTTYGIKVGESERQYMQTILSLPAMREWLADAAAETEVIEDYDRLARG